MSQQKDTMCRDTPNLLLYAVPIFMVSLAIRLAKMIVDPLLMRDCAVYLELAEIWHRSGVYSDTLLYGIVIPPLPLFLIKEMMKTGFSPEVCSRSIALFLSSFIPVFGFIGTYRLFLNKKTALFMAGILAVHPSLVLYAGQPLRENNYMFALGLLFVFFADAIRTRSAMKWALCGAACTLAFFCRYEALEMIVILPLVIFLVRWKSHLPYRYCRDSLCVFFLAIIASTAILLSVTGYDCSFLYKVKRYGSDIEFDQMQQIQRELDKSFK